MVHITDCGFRADLIALTRTLMKSRTSRGTGLGVRFRWCRSCRPQATGTPQAPGTLQWHGAYGHKWFIDPANELTVVALTNTAFEGMIGRFTVDIRNAVYGV